MPDKYLMRTDGGMVIHNEDCPDMMAPIPWGWADEETWPAVEQYVRDFDYLECGVCQPFTRLGGRHGRGITQTLVNALTG
ncbi:hypothetical protein [Mycolicibacterium sphagni]|uniref:hypothetical protein n=1 Tax=Mycolicibacterium sphagni TaxID=1786 RepID=UPI0021F2D7C3|nr:hypothetical protein [Mycolicibacterium sphagni]MCV7174914.1 hypothetical protein [Mycolicibacterium sphagni]